MALDVAGLRVLVTGASSGIGAGLAERFAAGGAVVGLTGRRVDALDEVLARCHATSPGSRRWVADMADPAAVDRLAADVVADLGGVDILVNNAGIPKRRSVTALDMATVEHVMRVNYLAPVQLTLALLPHMVERGSGRIVNVSSIAATLASPNESAYDASKAALSSFSEAMAVDIWETGVKVLVVYPGLVDTPLFSVPDNDPLPEGAVDPISVDELVDGVIDALDRGVPEVYLPGWFKDVATSKAADLTAFQTGTAAWLKERGGTR